MSSLQPPTPELRPPLDVKNEDGFGHSLEAVP